MSTRELRTASSAELGADGLPELRALMDAAFGTRFDDLDFDHCLGGTHVVLRLDGVVVAHAAVVPRRLLVGERVLRCGYVEAVATHPDHQGQGLGTAVMDLADELVRRCFDVGALSTSAHRFYERLGWSRWRGPTYVVRGGTWVRCRSEDGAVMVLPVRPSDPLDPGLPVAVDERPGDDW